MGKSSFYHGSKCHAFGLTAGQEDAIWAKIQEATGGALSAAGTRLLRSGLNGYAQTVVVETAYVCKDYRNLYSHFYSKKFLPQSSHCSRLHFFDGPLLTVDEVIFDGARCQPQYMGYSIVEPVAGLGLGRTMLDPFKIGHDPRSFFCLRTPSKIRIQGTEYMAHGFPYRSQTAEAMVCAHAALWCACRYLSDRYHSYRELYPYDLVEMTGDMNGRRVPYRSMTWLDYSTILSEFGCHPAIIRPRVQDTTAARDWSQDAEAFYDFYAYVESGFPVLTSFRGHVVNVIGHTLTDSLQPKHKPSPAGFHNSAAFVKEYIVVDDNFFPYQLLGYQGAQQYYRPTDYGGMRTQPSIDAIFAAVVPLAEKAYLQPHDARDRADRFLKQAAPTGWVRETVNSLGCAGQPLIARQFLTTASAWKGRKRDAYLDNPQDTLLSYPIALNLPHFIWVTELSVLDKYKQRQCFGEIVVDATLGKLEWQPIYTRIGRYLDKSGKCQHDSSAGLCYPQFTHNLGRL